MTNIEKFLMTYKKHLKDCVLECPENYTWNISELDEVFNRMKFAISRGTFNKDSSSFRRTCKELKIKHTYKAISEFIRTLDNSEGN